MYIDKCFNFVTLHVIYLWNYWGYESKLGLFYCNNYKEELEDKRILEKDVYGKIGPYKRSSDLGTKSGTKVDGDSLSEKLGNRRRRRNI